MRDIIPPLGRGRVFISDMISFSFQTGMASLVARNSVPSTQMRPASRRANATSEAASVEIVHSAMLTINLLLLRRHAILHSNLWKRIAVRHHSQWEQRPPHHVP